MDLSSKEQSKITSNGEADLAYLAKPDNTKKSLQNSIIFPPQGILKISEMFTLVWDELARTITLNSIQTFKQNTTTVHNSASGSVPVASMAYSRMNIIKANLHSVNFKIIYEDRLVKKSVMWESFLFLKGC